MADYFHIASNAPEAQAAKAAAIKRYGQAKGLAKAKAVFAYGGDGCAIRSLRRALLVDLPVFAINYGHDGFLTNPATLQELPERLAQAQPFDLAAIEATAIDRKGRTFESFAINEVLVCHRSPTHSVHLAVTVDGQEYLPKLEGDGLILVTAVGSTGYSRAAGGPVVSLGRDVLIVTPNNPCSPKARPPAIVLDPCSIGISVLTPDERSVDVYADILRVAQRVESLTVGISKKHRFRLLFDPGYDHRRRALQAHRWESMQPG